MIKAFLQYIQYEKNYSSHTVLSYNKDLIEYSDYLSSVDKLLQNDDITHQDLRLWMLFLMENGNKASTVNRKLSALKSFYKFHNAADTLKHNPTLKIIAPQKVKPLPSFFREKDLDKLLQVKKNSCTFEDVRDILIIEMFYQTGIRCSELTNIRDVDIDLSNNSLKINGKGNKQRIIPFGNDLKGKIVDYFSLRDKEITPLSESFFKLKSGKGIYQREVYKIVKENMSLVSTMNKRGPHVLRHTFATTMLNGGADINAIKSILGHESLIATQIYTHTTFDKLHDIYEQAHPRALKKRRHL